MSDSTSSKVHLGLGAPGTVHESHDHSEIGFLRKYIFSTDHKVIGIQFMLTGLVFTFSYIVYFKFVSPELNVADNWLFGISPEGIGAIGMLLNFAVAISVSYMTAPPPEHIQHMVENIRVPRAVEEG